MFSLTAYCVAIFGILLSVRKSICTVTNQVTNNLGRISWLKCSHLSPLSNDNPVKSKKLKYSDATNWLNSLLQEKQKERDCGYYDDGKVFHSTPFPIQYTHSYTNAHFLPRCRATSHRLKPSR